MDYVNIAWNYTGLYSDKHEIVQEFYRMQSKTMSVLSINNSFGKKLFTSLLLMFFSEVGFFAYQSSFFIKLQIIKLSKNF